MSKVLRTALETNNSSARRSQRRINKLMQKNISEYQIPNPYRSFKSQQNLPYGLGRQLSKLDYLSVRSLHNLSFEEPTANDEVNQLLLKMRFAVQRQSEEFSAFISEVTEKMKKYAQQTHYESNLAEQSGNSQNQPEENENSLQMALDDHEQAQLPLVSRHSEGASMMSDNYESDKLVFHSDPNLADHHHGFEPEEPLDPYYM